MGHAPNAGRTILIVGGGFSGTLLALKLSSEPGLRVVLIEREAVAGHGLAYGACEARHVLNVPVSRMEVGLQPEFGTWLGQRPRDVTDALQESAGELSRAFVARRLYGLYLAERLNEVITAHPARLVRVRGEAVRVEDKPAPAILLADGRRFEGDAVVLATGNQPPKPPHCKDDWFYDTLTFVPDPWCHSDLNRLSGHEPVLFIGTGLTMVDVALSLAARGHRGPMLAVSRHGRLPHTHLAPVGEADTAGTILIERQALEAASGPSGVLRVLRKAVERARQAGMPWQRVMDAARPHLAGIWNRWTLIEKSRFLRHGRSLWDIHRHRMAPRISADLAGLLASGQLQILSGRIAGFERTQTGIRILLRRQHGKEPVTHEVQAIVNCTGPRSDFATLGVPLFADLRRAGRLVPDALGLGIETQDCALVDRFGTPSPWLFAIGPLTRPAWWEITAVPEISAQVHRLSAHLSQHGAQGAGKQETGTLLDDFIHLGEGI